MSYLRGLELAGFARRHLGRMKAGRRAVDGAPRRPAPREPADADVPPAARHEPLQPALQDVRAVGGHGDLPRRRSLRPPRPTGSRARAHPGADRPEAAARRSRTTCVSWTRSRRRNPIVSLFGGEPFLYPDILPLIREIKSRGLTCTVITNGGRLEALARELVESGHRLDRGLDRRPAGGPQPDPRAGGQLREGGRRDPRGRAVAQEARPRAADADRDPARHGAQHGRDRAGHRGAARRCLSTRSTSGCAGSSRRTSGAEYEARHARETFGVAATPGRVSTSTGPAVAATEGAADGRAGEAAQGPEAPALPRLRRGTALGLVRPGRPGREACPSTSPISRRPSATTSARSPGTSRRSSPTARCASAATSPTTSSATCAGSLSGTSGRGRRPGGSARSSPRSRFRSAPAAAAASSTASGRDLGPSAFPPWLKSDLPQLSERLLPQPLEPGGQALSATF